MADSNLFSFENHSLHAEILNGEPWFLAKDLCSLLGYTNPRKAVIDHIDAQDVTKRYTLARDGKQRSLAWVNESGMYALIFGSKLPSALRFKRWVTSEVLPALRRQGSYSVSPSPRRPPVVAGPFVQCPAALSAVPRFDGIPPVLRDLEDLVRGISGIHYAVTEAFHRSFARGGEPLDAGGFDRDNLDVLRIFRSEKGAVLFEIEGLIRIFGIGRHDPAVACAACEGIRITSGISERFDLPFNMGFWRLCDPANAVFLSRLGTGVSSELASGWLFNSVFPSFGLSYAEACRALSKIKALE